MYLYEYVKQYALDHYEDGGWDVIVECFDDEEIADRIAEYGATTPAEALEAFATFVDVMSDRQADARNSVF